LESNSKRTYYKKWWFWLIGIVLIIASTISPPQSTVSSITATAGIITAPATLTSGTYKIGTDIKAGEYVLIAEEGADVQTFEFSGFFNSYNLDVSGIKRITVTLIDGQYLKLEAKSCKIYPVNSAPKFELSDGKLYAGTYKVGVDLPAGKYKLYDYTNVTVSVYSDSTFILYKREFSYKISGVKEIDLIDGQTICIENRYVVLTPITGATSTGTSYKSGVYKVGRDISEGEYVIIANDVLSVGQIDITTDLSGDYKSMLFSDYVYGRSIVTLKKDTYLNAKSCTIYPISSAPKVEPIEGIYPEGMYKVGVDIPAGDYKLVAMYIFNVYYEITDDSIRADYLTKDISINGTQNVTLKEGQYIRVERAYIVTINAATTTLTTATPTPTNSFATSPTPKSTPIATSTPIPTPNAYSIKAGMYKVGTDIEAGEYVVVAVDGETAYLEVAKDSTGTLESIITNENFKSRMIITVSAGQYLEVVDGTIYPINYAPKVEKINGKLTDGMYKVGVDLPAGEYKVVANTGTTVYYEVARDSIGILSSIVTNGNISGERYITVKDGQYITILDGYLK